jgi:hypothetical protein
MTVILATWKAKIQRIMLSGQLGQKFVKPHLNEKKLSTVACACHPSDGGKLKMEDQGAGQTGQKVRSYLQNNNQT